MNKEQRDKLFMEARNKDLKLTTLAEMVGCSPSMLSKYFRHQANLSSEKESKLAALIQQSKQYAWRKVEV